MSTLHYAAYFFSMKNLKLIIRKSTILHDLLYYVKTYWFQKKDLAGLLSPELCFVNKVSDQKTDVSCRNNKERENALFCSLWRVLEVLFTDF